MNIQITALTGQGLEPSTYIIYRYTRHPSEQLTNSRQPERTDWDILSPSLCHKFCDSTSQFQVLLDFPSTEKIPHLCIQEIFTELYFLAKMSKICIFIHRTRTLTDYNGQV